MTGSLRLIKYTVAATIKETVAENLKKQNQPKKKSQQVKLLRPIVSSRYLRGVVEMYCQVWRRLSHNEHFHGSGSGPRYYHRKMLLDRK